MYEDDSGRSELDGEREYYWEQAWSDLTREDKWESPWGNAERGMANKDPDWGWPADASELRRLRQAAEIGDIAAMRQLAKAYYSGFGATRDFEESVKWQARAEKSGDAETALALVRATLDKECPDKLAHWEQTVVELCSVETICALGNLYRRQANGEYKAARFYEIAAGRGCLEAQLKLARLWLERWKDSKIYWRNPGWRWLVAAFDNHDGGEGSPAFEEMRRIADEYGIQTVLNDIGLPRLRRALYGESRTAAKPSREAGEHLRAGTACLRQGREAAQGRCAMGAVRESARARRGR